MKNILLLAELVRENLGYHRHNGVGSRQKSSAKNPLKNRGLPNLFPHDFFSIKHLEINNINLFYIIKNYYKRVGRYREITERLCEKTEAKTS